MPPRSAWRSRALLQWLWLLIACARDDVSMKLVRPRWTARVARLVKLATPVAIGGGAQQISTMLDVVWASLLPVGTISALYYADRIAQLPLGVVGIAIGTALLPLLARELRAGHAEAAMANQNRAIEFGLLFSLPAAVALWLLSRPRSSACCSSAAASGPTTPCAPPARWRPSSVGLPAFVLVKALTPGFFAREDTRTPLYIASRRPSSSTSPSIVFFLYGTDARPRRHCARLLAVGMAERRTAGACCCRRAITGSPDQRLISRVVAHGWRRPSAWASPSGGARGAGSGRWPHANIKRRVWPSFGVCAAGDRRLCRCWVRCWASCVCPSCAS